MLPIVGGNVALDFANTQSGPPGGEPDVDSLAGYGDFVAWALRVGVVGPPGADELVRQARRHPREADAAFDRATALRDRIFTIFSSIAEDAPPSADALARVRDDEAEALAHADLATRPGGFAWTWSRPGDLDALRWSIVHAAATLLTGGPLDGSRHAAVAATCSWTRRRTVAGAGAAWRSAGHARRCAASSPAGRLPSPGRRD